MFSLSCFYLGWEEISWNFHSWFALWIALFLALCGWGDIGLMLVDTNQWRAAIGLFRLSSCVSLRMPLSIQASLMMWHVLRLYTFCYIFITLAIFILPFSMITQGILLYFGCSRFSFLHVFAHSYSRCKKVFHLTWNLTVLILIQLCSNCSCAVIRKVVFLYCYGTCTTLNESFLSQFY